MCCCIPLRKLSYLGASLHLLLGVLYFYYIGTTAYNVHRQRDKEKHEERLKIGLLYIGYYAAFLPPGIFIFWGVHKKQRCFLVVPSILFMVIQGYGMALEGIYKFRPHGLPEVMEKYNHETFVRSAQADYWMDMFTQTAITITYLAMLFFYYREIGPEDESNPATRSRYAQAFLPQSQPPEAQGPHPFRPVSQASILASNPNLRNSTTPPVSIPPMSLLSNITYEQQQQLLKLQQHPLILQQFQPHPFQEMMAEPHSRGQHHSHHLQDQTPLSLFHHNPKF